MIFQLFAKIILAENSNLSLTDIFSPTYVYNVSITVLQVDSNTDDETVGENWLATCDDIDEIDVCNEFTLYCKFDTVDRNDSICNCRSDVSVREDK